MLRSFRCNISAAVSNSTPFSTITAKQHRQDLQQAAEELACELSYNKRERDVLDSDIARLEGQLKYVQKKLEDERIYESERKEDEKEPESQPDQ